MPKTKAWEYNNPYWEIQGLVTDGDDEAWHPLYQYGANDQMKARVAFNRIIELDDLPRELAHYEDFRLQPPDHEPSEAPEAPQRAVTLLKATAEGEAPDPPPRRKKKRRKAPAT